MIRAIYNDLYSYVLERGHCACWPQSLDESGSNIFLIVAAQHIILEEQLRPHPIHLQNYCYYTNKLHNLYILLGETQLGKVSLLKMAAAVDQW